MEPGGVLAEIYTCSSSADNSGEVSTLGKAAGGSLSPRRRPGHALEGCWGKVRCGYFLCDPFEQGGGARRGLLPSHTSKIQLQLSQDLIPLVHLLIKLRAAAQGTSGSS